MPEPSEWLSEGVDADPPHEMDTAAPSSTMAGSEAFKRLENMASHRWLWMTY
jgi:hypothetical protein